MAYQCKEPCHPPPTDVVAQCSADAAQDSCPFTDTAQCIQTCDRPPLEACSAPDSSFSYQSKQPCTAPSFGGSLCPMGVCVPCGSPCLSLHTEMGAASSPCVPCESGTLQPCSPCPEDPQPCRSGTADACAPPSPPTCGCSCSDPQGGGGMPYVCPGSIVCLEPSGSVSVKPGVSSPELEGTTMFLASYTPHFM